MTDEWEPPTVEAQVAAERAAVESLSADALKQELAEKRVAVRSLQSRLDDNDAFMAYMTEELAGFKCCCEDGEHRSTPPYMWPELIKCIRKRGIVDAQKL